MTPLSLLVETQRDFGTQTTWFGMEMKQSYLLEDLRDSTSFEVPAEIQNAQIDSTGRSSTLALQALQTHLFFVH